MADESALRPSRSSCKSDDGSRIIQILTNLGHAIAAVTIASRPALVGLTESADASLPVAALTIDQYLAPLCTTA